MYLDILVVLLDGWHECDGYVNACNEASEYHKYENPLWSSWKNLATCECGSIMTSAGSKKICSWVLFEAMRQLTNIANILIYHDNCCKTFLKISSNGNTMINSTYLSDSNPNTLLYWCPQSNVTVSIYLKPNF